MPPKTVPVSPERLRALVKKYGSPLYLYDEAGIRATARTLLDTFSAKFDHGFAQFFAVKALPNPAICKLLVDEGCGLDCSSVAEIQLAKELGVPGDRVMYTSNYTSEADLKTAMDQGVILNLDDLSLVETAARVNGGKLPERVSFRLNPGLGRTDSETKSNVLGGPDAKFGVPREDIIEAYRAAQTNGATKFGIHMMTGSCVLNSGYWSETVAVLHQVMAELKSELGIQMDFVNIGGGLGVAYRPEEAGVDLEETSDAILKPFLKMPEPVPKLFMENGRYVTGPHGYLVSTCQSTKRAYGTTFYGLDSAMHCLMRPGMYDSYHHITVPEREGTGGRALANVVGTLCENNDWFAKRRDLPSNIELGDLFVIHDAGAHALSMGFNYNSKLKPPEVLLRSDGGEDLIRKRETFDSLVYNTVMPKDLAVKTWTRGAEVGDGLRD
jgi:diaminopimelate decarboxylase